WIKKEKVTAIRRRSKTPGVMITQYAAILPEGKSTPDFQCKPMPVTVKEGNLAIFKAVVTGDPKPDVSWRRAKGNLADKEKFQRKYDESTGEHILEIHKVSAEEADTYKCYAMNECGKAVCTTTLSIIDGSTIPEDFRKLKAQTAGGDNDETFWDAMMNADKRDYESICSEYGIADLSTILKKLEEKRNQKGKNKQKDVIISYDNDAKKQDIQSLGKKNYLRNEGTVQHDTGIYIGDVEEANLSNVDFVIKIQEIKAEESDDALFECVLTHPLPKITWMRKGVLLEDGEKCNITVSDNRLIHRLLIKDCTKLDKGIYSAVAGIISCSAWLVEIKDSADRGKYQQKPSKKDCDLRCAPTFTVPLKPQTATVGYECYMSCAVKGDPAARITWYRNHVSINTDTNYYVSNTCGVCSLLILRVGPKDVGEYKVVAENSLGRAECSTVLSVRGKTETWLHFCFTKKVYTCQVILISL
uniref:Immunoglobulin-like and fibronectin type III domain-containing protein 1 n=1 Tax=Poecilia latipinna TaxID=48699 RepID=A0A3B3VBB5_9TELE